MSIVRAFGVITKANMVTINLIMYSYIILVVNTLNDTPNNLNSKYYLSDLLLDSWNFKFSIRIFKMKINLGMDLKGKRH